MSKLVSSARTFFRRKKNNSIAPEHDKERLVQKLAKRIGSLSKKMVEVKIKLANTSLEYLELVQDQLRKRAGRKLQLRQASSERRKLPKLVMRMKSAASILKLGQRGKVVKFQVGRDTTATRDRP